MTDSSAWGHSGSLPILGGKLTRTPLQLSVASLCALTELCGELLQGLVLGIPRAPLEQYPESLFFDPCHKKSVEFTSSSKFKMSPEPRCSPFGFDLF